MCTLGLKKSEVVRFFGTGVMDNCETPYGELGTELESFAKAIRTLHCSVSSPANHGKYWDYCEWICFLEFFPNMFVVWMAATSYLTLCSNMLLKFFVRL